MENERLHQIQDSKQIPDAPLSEREYLENYDPSAYERPSVTVDILLFIVDAEELKVLLIRRDTMPFYGKWAIPGGFLHMDESAQEAAIRRIREEAGVENVHLEQLYTFSEVERDPRTRVISIAYFACVPNGKLGFEAGTETSEAALFSVHGGTGDKNPDLFLTLPVFRDFTLIARHEKHLEINGTADTLQDEEVWLSPDREILDPSLVTATGEPYETLISMQRGKPRFIPPKEELLKYKDTGYSESTPQKAALASYLTKKVGNPEIADLVLHELTIMIRKMPERKAQEIMDYFGRMGVTLKNRDDAQTLMNLFADYSNNTRMQANNGYTPEELYREMVQKDEPRDTGRRKIKISREEAEDSSGRKPDVREGILDALSGLPGEDLRKNLADAMDKPKDSSTPVWSGDLIKAQK